MHVFVCTWCSLANCLLLTFIHFLEGPFSFLSHLFLFCFDVLLCIPGWLQPQSPLLPQPAGTECELFPLLLVCSAFLRVMHIRRCLSWQTLSLSIRFGFVCCTQFCLGRLDAAVQRSTLCSLCPPTHTHTHSLHSQHPHEWNISNS